MLDDRYYLATSCDANRGIIQCFHLAKNGASFAPISAPNSAAKDPYYDLGSHPDVVTRVWDELGAALPVDCRCLLYGTPALVAPTSGVVLVAAYGTQYLLRLPEEAVPLAIKAGARTTTKWSSGGEMDVSKEVGPDWIFGGWIIEELHWCRTVYESVESARSND